MNETDIEGLRESLDQLVEQKNEGLTQPYETVRGLMQEVSLILRQIDPTLVADSADKLRILDTIRLKTSGGWSPFLRQHATDVISLLDSAARVGLRQAANAARTPGAEPTALEKALHILDRFHLVARQLRRRYNSRDTLLITDEYDVQDLLRALLQMSFEDVRPEERTPSYAGKSSRMDFLLKQKTIAIEVKMTREGLDDGKLGEELIIDCGHYKEHPSVSVLICFVYDPDERLRNPRGLENDLTYVSETLEVVTVVRPR